MIEWGVGSEMTRKGAIPDGGSTPVGYPADTVQTQLRKRMTPELVDTKDLITISLIVFLGLWAKKFAFRRQRGAADGKGAQRRPRLRFVGLGLAGGVQLIAGLEP